MGCNEKPKTTINSNVVVIPDASYVSSDVSNVVLVNSPDLKIDNIIIGSADGGFIRRIKSIQKINNQTILITDAATLEDVFTEGDFGLDYDAQGEDINNPMTYSPIQFGKTLKVDIKQNILKDPVTGSSVYVSGNVQTTPKFFFDASIKRMKFRNIEYRVSGDIDSNLYFVCDGIVGHNFGDIPIAFFPFVPLVIMVGNIPLVFTPYITLYVGVEAYTEGTVTYNINKHTDFDLGGIYDGNGWTKIKDINEFAPVYTKELYNGADGKIWIKAVFGLNIMMTSNLSVRLMPYSRFHGDILKELWSVYLGVDTGANFNLKVLSWNIINWNQTIWSDEWLVYEG
jgi:hypothetical protein